MTHTASLSAPLAGGALTPPPRSRALAAVAVGVAAAALLGVGVLGGTATAGSPASSTGHTIGWILSTVGVVLGAAVLWVAARALMESLKAARDEKAENVLEARAHAAASHQNALISFGLVVALLVGVGLVLLVTMNNGSVQKTFLRWDLIASSALGVIQAFGVNIFIAVVAEVFILVLGLVLAIARMLPSRAGRPVRALAIAYIDAMRAVPAIIVIYLVGFGLPLAGIPVISKLPAVWFAIIALTLTYSAYVAESYRSGIEAIHPSQWSATRSLGFSYAQTLRFVTLPQAVRVVIPTLLSSFIALQKDTSLVNIIGTMDAFNQAKYYASNNFNLSSVTVVAALFIIVTIPQTRFVDWMLARPRTRHRPPKGRTA